MVVHAHRSRTCNLVLDPLFIFGIGPFHDWASPVAAGGRYHQLFHYRDKSVFYFFTQVRSCELYAGIEAGRSVTSLWTMLKSVLPGGVNTAPLPLSRAVVMPLLAIFRHDVSLLAYGHGSRVSQIGILMVVAPLRRISPLIGNLAGADWWIGCGKPLANLLVGRRRHARIGR